ncbi:pectin lyase fold/virulence factor [Chaetomium strumarium]|uniref:Pectin lyase fold/virulence factor n=1 Tax=Chaetomium strumarium TaxID=1170767 RepID=A0AAJ0GRX0_9PEZI|nr:pectin lyase fold/virulence factor [Chaetomium strumarium]
MVNLAANTVIRGGYSNQSGTRTMQFNGAAAESGSPGSGYWLPSLATLGTQPLAGDGYQFFRDVTDFGADNTGKTDASEAINAAVSSWSKSSAKGGDTRCGKTCGNTFTQGAIVYFPAGTYKICKPVVQLYYTQFIGDASKPPTIKGCRTFEGIALFDTDPYIPGGAGAQWYINQNQFFRQIRNFIFDMPRSTAENDQQLVPTGIHWQVAQATSLQNLVLNMPKSSGSSSANATTAVGIFTENGSGGFVSDLTFNGGSIGWRVGSQQFTARNLKFNDYLTAIQMIWDWGFTWQGIEIHGGAAGFNISGAGGATGQGTGSVSLVDCSVNDVPVGILTSNNAAKAPNIVLDNTVFSNVDRIIQADGGDTILSENSHLWATGKRYNGSVGSSRAGNVEAPAKAKSLLDKNSKLFVPSRPQYETLSADSFLAATTDGGCQNNGTGDQTICLNSFLQKAVAANKIAFFPAGIYTVGRTVMIPTGSRVQGSSWSQIQGARYYSGDMQNPKVMVRDGNRGDVGTMEIVEMLFSVRGGTAGAVLMEWNTAAVDQGAAAMWDSHFRVGGGKGTDLDLVRCPKFSANDDCIAASLMFHLTAHASGYFENVWAWVADHDNDVSIYNQPDSSSTQISIFGARGMLIEWQGPSWLYGGGSEHSVLYNYLLSDAKSVYMGHMQTVSPYFQPNPGAPVPFEAASEFANDPDFSQCNLTASTVDERCRYAWGLRVVDSTDVTIHSAGLYSFFNEYYQDCIETNNCQERILESDANQRGFTTEVGVWVPLPGKNHDNVVYVGPDIFTKPTMSCSAPCVLLHYLIREYGTVTTTSLHGAPTAVFVTSTTTVIISIPPITVSGMPYSNVNVTSGGEAEITVYPSISVPPVTVGIPDGRGSTTSRTVPLPPWPLVNQGPSGTNLITDPGRESPSKNNTNTGSLTSRTTYHTGITSTVVAPFGLTVTTVTFPRSIVPTTISCPATTEIAFATPAITVRTTCTDSGSLALTFSCPASKIGMLLAATVAVVNADCTLVTAWSTGQYASSTTEPLPVWVTWPRYGSIVPVTTPVSSPQPTDNGVVVPCSLWFSFLCISWGEIHGDGWVLALPPGTYGPGPLPPDYIRWPPGFGLQGTVPPWPRITIGDDHWLTTDDKQPECETQTAQLCTTTTFFSATTTSHGVTTTTLTSTSEHCETITGCSVRDSQSSATSTNVEVGTQVIAPVGTWYSEAWPAPDMGAAYGSSVFAVLSADIAADSARAGGPAISFMSGPTASPTCVSGTGCGGRLCSGYWCTPHPSDPNSVGYSAPRTTIKSSSSSTTTITRSKTCTITDLVKHHDDDDEDG